MKTLANLLMLLGTSVLMIAVMGFVAKAYYLLFMLGWGVL